VNTRPSLLQCSMFNRVRGISLLAQARQSRVWASCKGLVISSIYHPHPGLYTILNPPSPLSWYTYNLGFIGFAWNVANVAKNYNVVRADNVYLSTSALASKRYASTSASGTILDADSVDAQMQACLQSKDFQTALDVIERAQALGVVKPEHYEQLFALEIQVKADLISLARIAHWFTSTPGQLPAKTVEELDVWKSAMKACFKLARSHLHSDLDVLLKAFIKSVNTDSLHDAEAWAIVLRVSHIYTLCLIPAYLTSPDNNDYLGSWYFEARKRD
jgi:hypothetical protein